MGTDAVLLGAWAGENGDYQKILDIGCGCGLIGIMAAQRFANARITGIDIHRDSVNQARENVAATAWSTRLQMQNLSLQEFSKSSKEKFDLIISNPPYFSHSLLPPVQHRKYAKHTEKLSYADLAACAAALLSKDGLFALILPSEKQDEFTEVAAQNHLYLNRSMNIIPIDGKNPNRIMSEWSHHKKAPEFSEICIRNAKKEYTGEYKKLTADFYLAH